MSRAFTLIELLIVLVIIGLISFMTAGAVASLSNSTKLWMEPKRIFTLIQQTRNLAITKKQFAVLCPSENSFDCKTDWQLPLIQFIDDNNNRKRDPFEPLISQISPYLNVDRQIQYPRSQIRFDSAGRINGFTGTLAYCSIGKTTGIILSRVGRIRFAQDLDSDGIPDIEPNKPVICTTNL